MPSRMRFLERVARLLGGGRRQAPERIPHRLPDSPDFPKNVDLEAVPTSGYEYDPRLVPRLKEDHQVLVRLFTDLGGYLRRRENPTRFIRETLQTSFSSHLILERYFYDSLEAHATHLNLGDDPEVWRQFSESMKGIARAVNLFLAEIVAGRMNDINHAEYMERYEQIMEVLGRRIADEEERLYVIYERQLGRRSVASSAASPTRFHVVRGRFGTDS